MGEKLNLKKLRGLAEKATPGPWKAVNHEEGGVVWPMVKASVDHLNPYGVHLCELRSEDGDNAMYMANVDPQTILKLLDVVEAADNLSMVLLTPQNCKSQNDLYKKSMKAMGKLMNAVYAIDD